MHVNKRQRHSDDMALTRNDVFRLDVTPSECQRLDPRLIA